MLCIREAGQWRETHYVSITVLVISPEAKDQEVMAGSTATTRHHAS
jgi:hypothetical protein